MATAIRENLDVLAQYEAQLSGIGEMYERQFAAIEEGRRPVTPTRTGYGSGIPVGGTTPDQPGGDTLSQDRATMLQELLMAYMACPFAASAVDVIARTCTAGGLEVVPESSSIGSSVTPKTPPTGVKRIQQLFKYVNPEQDIRQIMRMVITDMLIFGDAYLEVVWFGKEPIALYHLDPTTMTILSDEHGKISGYYQKTTTNRTARFKPREVIHFKFDTPGDSLYGVSPTQKNILSITTWIFAAALLKETMRRGDPLRAHVDWPIALPDTEMRRFGQQYSVRNLGAKNIGNLFETKGGAIVKELGVNQIRNWLDVMQQRRDEMLSGYGVPPSKVGVVESGNIGSGTGTSQEKTFRVNTCGPLQEILLEKLNFALLYQAYGVNDWFVKFSVVDWRDDEVIEKIRDERIRNGLWTLNRARADIGEPPVRGGDVAVLVDRQNMVVWDHLEELSRANVDLVRNQADSVAAKTAIGDADGGTGTSTKNAPVNSKTNPGGSKPGQSPASGDAPSAPGGTEAFRPYIGYGMAVDEDGDELTGKALMDAVQEFLKKVDEDDSGHRRTRGES